MSQKRYIHLNSLLEDAGYWQGSGSLRGLPWGSLSREEWATISFDPSVSGRCSFVGGL
jgi:hypothetical protein